MIVLIGGRTGEYTGLKWLIQQPRTGNPNGLGPAQLDVALELVRAAKQQGLVVTGLDGLVKQSTKAARDRIE